MNKKLAVVFVFLFIAIIFIISGFSYAIITRNLSGEEYYVLSAGNLDFEILNEGNGISLNNSYPMSDSEGMKLTPYTFSLRNNDSIDIKYEVKLEQIKTGNDVNIKTIKAFVQQGEESNGPTLLDNSSIICEGVINPGQTLNFKLNIWLDKDSTITEEGKTFKARVNIIGKQMIDGFVGENSNYLYEIVKSKSLGKDTDLINFSEHSGMSNTNGVYTTTKTESGKEVYFYRGNVDNNVIFGGYCWKIIRTTETGGVKLIYNGTPTSDGKCNKPNFTAGTETARSGTISMSSSATYYYGTSYTFNETTGVYSLAGTITSGVWSNTSKFINKYTCKSTSQTGTCSTLYKITGYSSTTSATYSSLGRTINTETGTMLFNINNNDNAYVGYLYGTTGASTYAATHRNANNSIIKVYLEGTDANDGWFNTSGLKNYQDRLEDTVFCNDRSTVDGTTNNTLGSSYGTLGYGINATGYGALARSSYNTTSPNPTYTCSQANDKFTLKTETGNGKLKYPVGLITLDEAIFAGFNTYASNNSNYKDTNNYLYTGSAYWTFSPVNSNSNGGARVGIVNSTGHVGGSLVDFVYGVRPVVSLIPGTQAELGGDGSKENPYVVK